MHMMEERRREKERWQRIQAMVELYMWSHFADTVASGSHIRKINTFANPEN